MKRLDLKSMFFMLMAAATMPLFAAEDLMPAGMQALGDNILATFTGGVVKTILIIALVACAIAYGVNKDNEGLKKKLMAIGIAIAIIGSASFIVGKFWDAAKTNG